MAEVLSKLEHQSVLPREVLIVDNGGTLSDELVRGMPLADRAVLISRPDNPGYAAAVNEARTRLEGDPLLVLTHDAAFGETLAESLATALNARVDAGSVAPVLRFASDPSRLFSAGGRLTRGGRAAPWLHTLAETPYRVDWVDGAIVMYSADALDAIGWLDEGYFLYFEDVDTGWRLGNAGYSCLIEPREIAYQEPGEHPWYLGVRNMTLFARKAGIPLSRFLPSLSYRVLREGVARLRRGRAVPLSEIWRGLRDGRAGVRGAPAATR